MEEKYYIALHYLHTIMNVVVKAFPDEVWRTFKSVAVKNGMTVKDALTVAAKEWSEKHE